MLPVVHRYSPLSRQLLVAALAYLLFGLIAARGIFNGGFAWDEAVSEYIPWRVEAGRQIAAGHFPFFTPNLFGGMPLFSLAYTGVLYPPNLLYAIFPPQLANWLQLLHTVVGGLGMLVYLRSRRLVPAVSFLGGLFFIANTFLITHQGHIAMREAATLAPWVAWGALRILRRPTTARAAVLALLLALQIAAGYLQVTVFTVAWIGLDWLASLGPGRRSPRATLWLALAGGLGFALMAVQILATMEHVPQTPRVHMTMENWQLASFSPSHALIFLAPRLFGIHSELYVGDSHAGELIVTVPACAWALAAAAVAMVVFRTGRRNGGRGMLVVVYTLGIVLSFLLALGSNYEPNAGLFHLPPFSMFRVPARWLFLSNTLAVVLAGIGLQWLLGLRPWARLITLLLSWGAFAALCIALFLQLASFPAGSTAFALHPLDLLLEGTGVSDLRVSRALGALAPGTLADLPAMQLLLSVIAACAALGARRRPRAACTLAFLVLAADQAILNRYACRPPEPLPQVMDIARHRLLAGLPPGSITRLYGVSPHGDNLGGDGVPHATALFLGVPSLNGYSPLLSDRLYITMGVGQTGVSHRDPDFYRDPKPLRNLAVSHLIVQEGFLTAERRAAYEAGLAQQADLVKRTDGYALLALRNPRPRFDLARQWTPPSPDPLQPDVYVFQNAPGEPLPPDILEDPQWDLLPPADTPIRGASLEVLLDDPTHQRVRVKAPNGAVLLVRDVHWKGWRYRIEGGSDRHQAVRRANGVIRYVPVPKGDWVVDMVYTAPGFRTGLAISLAALAMVLGLLVVPRPRLYRRSREEE